MFPEPVRSTGSISSPCDMNPDWLLSHLKELQTASDEEARHLQQIIDFVSRQTRFHDRELACGHVTGSAWIVNPDYSRALLVHHRKLDRWLQPGGHIENDATVLDTALREAREECGLAEVWPVSEAIFDVDVHLIPATGKESAHFHYDVRFLLMTNDEATLMVSEESHAVRWFTADEILALKEGPSIERMVTKMLQQTGISAP